jgi:hypothetical protein
MIGVEEESCALGILSTRCCHLFFSPDGFFCWTCSAHGLSGLEALICLKMAQEDFF